MSARKVESTKWQMMELSDGITTSTGNWYHINAEQIEKYTPGLLKRIPLETIIKEADAWTKSADGLALMLFFILSYASVNPIVSTTVSLLFYFFWYFNVAAFISVPASKLIQTIIKDGVIYSVSTILLIAISFPGFTSSLGLSISFSTIWYGLVLFFFFKVGLLRMILKLVQSKTGKTKVEIQDRILNMLLIRYGMKYGILTGRINDMQDRLLDVANYHKTRKKK